MSVVALPGGMLGARSRLRPLPLSLVGWCASCNNNNSNNDNNKNNKSNNNNNNNNNNSWVQQHSTLLAIAPAYASVTIILDNNGKE